MRDIPVFRGKKDCILSRLLSLLPSSTSTPLRSTLASFNLRPWTSHYVLWRQRWWLRLQALPLRPISGARHRGRPRLRPPDCSPHLPHVSHPLLVLHTIHRRRSLRNNRLHWPRSLTLRQRSLDTLYHTVTPHPARSRPLRCIDLHDSRTHHHGCASTTSFYHSDTLAGPTIRMRWRPCFPHANVRRRNPGFRQSILIPHWREDHPCGAVSTNRLLWLLCGLQRCLPCSLRAKIYTSKFGSRHAMAENGRYVVHRVWVDLAEKCFQSCWVCSGERWTLT